MVQARRSWEEGGKRGREEREGGREGGRERREGEGRGKGMMTFLWAKTISFRLFQFQY